MTRIRLRYDGSRTVRCCLAALAVAGLTVAMHHSARAAPDVFQKAVNYVFTGEVDPQNAPKIVDRQACVVVMKDPKYDRFIRYRLRGFQMDTALFDKRYAGSQPNYVLDVKGDGVILEYLTPDQKSVAQAYRSAQIPLPGDFEQTQKALTIIFSDYCKPKKSQAPF